MNPNPQAGWYVDRKSKGTKKVYNVGRYDTKEEAQQVVKDGRAYQKEYTWSMHYIGRHWG